MAFMLTSFIRTLLFTGKDAEINEEDETHSQLPLIRSPVDPKAYVWLKKRREGQPGEPGMIRRSLTVAQFEQEHNDSGLAGRIFRKQEVASSLELFFDLFFVANLAVFTNNHAQIDALRCSWFHISIYDVRFYADSMLLRLAKMIHFGVMTAFVGLGPVYDTILENGQSRSFEGMGFVQMLLRFVLVLQYGSVLYFVHGFQKTLAPLLLMMLTYLASGFAFLATSLYGVDRLSGADGSRDVIRWYIILGIETVAVIAISSIWRVLSFKHTHVHERVGLLTLIVIGEGIIGMLKSVAYVLGGIAVSIWGILGLVSSTTIVIYFIYLLYFENVSHHHHGSIMQQVSLLLHYLLHLAIVLCVEGQSGIIRWVAIRSGITWLDLRGNDLDQSSSAALVSSLNSLITDTETVFHAYPLSYYYDPASDISAIESTNATVDTTEWNTTVSKSMANITSNLQYFVFRTLYAEGSEEELYKAKTAEQKVEVYNEAYGVIFEYYYISAGCLLIMLAIMYLVGKKSVKVRELVKAGIRLAGGIALACVSALGFLENGSETGFRYSSSGWIISVVALSYFGVLWLESWVHILGGRKKGKLSPTTSKDTTDEETAYQGYEMRQQQMRTDQKGERLDSRTNPGVHQRANGYSHVNQDDHDEQHAAQRSPNTMYSELLGSRIG